MKTKKKTSSGKKSAYVRGSKKNLPEWYDQSLTSARKNLNDKFNLLNKYPKDPYVRSALFNFRKHFRKLRKNKYREYKQNLLNKLDNLQENNPKEYWNLLDKLKKINDNSNASSNNVPLNEWHAYFKTLLTTDQKLDHVDNRLKSELKHLENQKIFNELDYKITAEEISRAVNKLKK